MFMAINRPDLQVKDATKTVGDRLKSTLAVFKEIGSNLISGKLTTGVQANTGIKSLDKVLTVATSPVGIASTALVGAGIATGVKAGITSATAKTATTAGATGGVTATVGAKPIATNTTTAPSPINTQPSLPKTVPETKPKVSPVQTNPSNAPSDNGVFVKTVKDNAQDLIQNNLPDVKEVLSGQKEPLTATGEVLKDSLPSTITPETVKAQASNMPKQTTKKSTTTKKTSTTKKKTSTRKKAKSKKKTSKKSSKKKYGTEAQYNRKGGKDVKYTKNGQPYILDSKGKARFIKKSK